MLHEAVVGHQGLCRVCLLVLVQSTHAGETQAGANTWKRTSIMHIRQMALQQLL